MWETIVTTMFGGALAITGGMFAQWQTGRRESRSIARAFAGEIGSILAIIEARKYAEGIRGCLEETLKCQKTAPFQLEVKI